MWWLSRWNAKQDVEKSNIIVYIKQIECETLEYRRQSFLFQYIAEHNFNIRFRFYPKYFGLMFEQKFHDSRAEQPNWQHTDIHILFFFLSTK